MHPHTSFPLWRKKGLCKSIQTSPRPRTDPNYRFGLSQSQSTFHQIMLECIHFFLPLSKTNKNTHSGLVVRNAVTAGIISVTSGWKLIDKRFGPSTQGTHKRTQMLNHHLVEYFFVLKWLSLRQQRVLGFIPARVFPNHVLSALHWFQTLNCPLP